MNATATIASESGHWYDGKTGEPRYTVVGKNGKERATRITDARSNGWIPSVTTITRIMAAPGLENWKQDQVLMSAATLPMAGLTEEAWRKAVKAEAKLKAQQAAERGTKLHAAIELALQEKPDHAYDSHYDAIDEATQAVGIFLRNGHTERSFACDLGYGGKVDWHNEAAIVDFKTKDAIGDKTEADLVYDEHRMQLAAYRRGLNLTEARCFNVFIGIDDCKVVVAEHTEASLMKGWRMFEACLALWREANDYRPGESVEDNIARCTGGQL